MTPEELTHSDRILLYNVNPWGSAGYGVPNFGSVITTQNSVARKLVDQLGRQQLYIMTHVDAGRTNYPSINTVKVLGKLINYALDTLAGRARFANEDRLEEGHSTPTEKPWIIHPVPYFQVNGAWVQNAELAEINELMMITLANAMQASDNDLTLELSVEFVQMIGSYLQRIKSIIAGEWLGLGSAVFSANEFRFAAEHYQQYNPSARYPSQESITQPQTIGKRPTETDLGPLLRGIPSTEIIANLAIYSHPSSDFSGSKNDQEIGSMNRDPFENIEG